MSGRPPLIPAVQGLDPKDMDEGRTSAKRVAGGTDQNASKKWGSARSGKVEVNYFARRGRESDEHDFDEPIEQHFGGRRTGGAEWVFTGQRHH